MTEEQKKAVLKALRSDAVRLLIGADEWSLTEEEEMLLWEVINSAE